MAVANKATCSFCGADSSRANKLIAGQDNMYICVDVCTQVLTSSTKRTDEPHFSVREQQVFCLSLQSYDENIINDMMKWLEENKITTWVKVTNKPDKLISHKIIFENESDLVAFKLRWV